MTTAALLFAMALGSVQAAAPAAGTPAKGPAAANPDDLLDAVRKADLAAVKAALDAGVPVDIRSATSARRSRSRRRAARSRS